MCKIPHSQIWTPMTINRAHRVVQHFRLTAKPGQWVTGLPLSPGAKRILLHIAGTSPSSETPGFAITLMWWRLWRAATWFDSVPQSSTFREVSPFWVWMSAFTRKHEVPRFQFSFNQLVFASWLRVITGLNLPCVRFGVKFKFAHPWSGGHAGVIKNNYSRAESP